MDQVNADGQGVVHALDMLFGQPANVFCQPLLIKGSYLLHQNDGGPLKAALCVDKVVGGQLRLYPHPAGNGRNDHCGTVLVSLIILDDNNGAIPLLF